MRTKVKVSIIVLTIGWFPFMFLCIWGSKNPLVSIISMFIGVIVCLCTSIILNTYLRDEPYWRSMYEIEKLREKYERAVDYYIETRNKLLKKLEE
jgi:hypothetical protein